MHLSERVVLHYCVSCLNKHIFALHFVLRLGLRLQQSYIAHGVAPDADHIFFLILL